MKKDPLDPKGLMKDAFAMPELDSAQCRSIFLDWALSVPQEADVSRMITQLLERHQTTDHPMQEVLREGLQDAPDKKRRGGRAARLNGSARSID